MTYELTKNAKTDSTTSVQYNILEYITVRNKHLDELFSQNEWFRNFQNCFSNDEISWAKVLPYGFELELFIENQFSAIFDIMKVPTFFADGSRKNLLVIGRDITEQKKAYDLFLKSEKLSVVSELAAGVAHEIRNPLTSIKGFMQIANQNGEFNRHHVQIMLSEISIDEPFFQQRKREQGWDY